MNYRKPHLKIAAILLSAVAAFPAEAADPPTRSCDLFNGRAWTTFDTREKEIYINGMRDLAGSANVGENWSLYAVAGLSIRDTSEAIDKAYQDSLNLSIPVPWMMKLIRFRADGAPQDKIDANFALFRKKASGCPELVKWME